MMEIERVTVASRLSTGVLPSKYLDVTTVRPSDCQCSALYLCVTTGRSSWGGGEEVTTLTPANHCPARPITWQGKPVLACRLGTVHSAPTVLYTVHGLHCTHHCAFTNNQLALSPYHNLTFYLFLFLLLCRFEYQWGDRELHLLLLSRTPVSCYIFFVHGNVQGWELTKIRNLKNWRLSRQKILFDVLPSMCLS